MPPSPPHPPEADSTRPTTTEARWLGGWFASMRQTGFLGFLSAESWQLLCVLLSFLTEEGDCRCTLANLAYVLDRPPDEITERLHHLKEMEWHGEPLISLQTDDTGVLIGATILPALTTHLAASGISRSDDVGSSMPPDPALVRELEAVGLYPEQIDWLLDRFAESRVRQQLDWLPNRQARNPAALLLQAIRDDWPPPRSLHVPAA